MSARVGQRRRNVEKKALILLGLNPRCIEPNQLGCPLFEILLVWKLEEVGQLFSTLFHEPAIRNARRRVARHAHRRGAQMLVGPIWVLHLELELWPAT